MYTGGGIVHGMAGLITLPALLLLAFWYLPEILALLCDIAKGRNLMAESEEQRQLEGRIFISDPTRDLASALEPSNMERRTGAEHAFSAPG